MRLKCQVWHPLLPPPQIKAVLQLRSAWFPMGGNQTATVVAALRAITPGAPWTYRAQQVGCLWYCARCDALCMLGTLMQRHAALVGDGAGRGAAT